LAALAVIVLSFARVAAQEYPPRPITLFVPFAAGGCTLVPALIVMSPALSLNRALPPRVEDFEHIGRIVDVPMTPVASQTMPAKGLTDFLALIRANREKIALADAGIGSASHFCRQLFNSTIETELTTVQYEGTAPVIGKAGF
jgi:tripartite-type tricarboxylate transporter receptor subunit TctC